MVRFNRVVLVILDSVGIGEMPDSAAWGDGGADTLGHVLDREKPQLPHLQGLGLGNIRRLPGLPPVSNPSGAFGKAAIFSNGKDTTVGHWEIAGIITAEPFPTYPHGFPPRIIDPFVRAIGCGILGNKPASGTEIIAELGEEHIRTGKPIVYTSADSVFQIAVHEEVVRPEELYRMCRIARELLDGPDRVARVIARPFVGSAGQYKRTTNRRDFAIPPTGTTLLDLMKQCGLSTVGVGKIGSIFDYRGVTEELHAANNRESMDQTIAAVEKSSTGLIFANFVDFDMLWGHRNDARGYAGGLAEFDRRLPELLDALRPDDCLIITADHGCDPTTPGTDHTREYVPLLVYAKSLSGGVDLGTRQSMADTGQTIAENFGLRLPAGTSYLGCLL
jgi:phosphopentomutase